MILNNKSYKLGWWQSSAQGGPASGWGQVFLKSVNYVYVLYSKKLKEFYVGKINDLKRRVRERKSGNSKFTASVEDWKLVYYEAFSNKKDATEEELFLKSRKGKERRRYLLKNFLENLN